MDQVDSFINMAVRKSWDSWFESYGVIKDVDGIWRGNEQEVPLTANYLQNRISDVVTWCQERDLPVRILGLKPRQRGCSTFSTSGLYTEGNKKPISAAIIGAKGKQAKNLFKMVEQYSNGDKHNWGTTRNCKAENIEFQFADGQKTEIGILSAKEYDPGRSGTYQFVLATEVARWAEDGVANAGDVLSGLLKCVQLRAGSTVILETTAAGASGDFYDRWGDALEFEEYQRRHAAGDMVEGIFIRVFAPWFMFPELAHELTPAQQDKVNNTLNQVERYNSPDFGNESQMMAQFDLSLGQLSWRRYAIDNECKRDPRVFEQDYPSTWESAFLTSGNRRFSSAGIRHLRSLAKKHPCKWGVLDSHTRDPNAVNWRATDQGEGIIQQWEAPRVGYRYLITADVATGADQTQGKDPDCHSVFVIRAGGWINGRGWMRPAAVARIAAPCRWEVDLLGEWIRRLHRYYRGAMVVPEINNPGLALLQHLKLANVTVFRREVYDDFERRFVKQLGFQTTTKSKPMVIARLAKALREYDVEGEGFDIYDTHAIDELQSFIRKPDGKEQAMEGMHDDDVMALGIGLLTIDNAVAYSNKYQVRETHPDLMEIEEQNERRFSQFS